MRFRRRCAFGSRASAKLFLGIFLVPGFVLMTITPRAFAHTACVVTYSTINAPGGTICCSSYSCDNGDTGQSCSACDIAQNHGMPLPCRREQQVLSVREKDLPFLRQGMSSRSSSSPSSITLLQVQRGGPLASKESGVLFEEHAQP